MEIQRFFRNLAIVISVTALLTGSVFFFIQPDPNSYFQGSVLKLNLLKTVPSPKIVVVGGSNIAFGIDSELIEESLGIPVINDGLNAGLSILPLEELKHYLNSGDIIVVSIEYVIFTFYVTGNPQEIADWVEYAPERIKYLSNPIAEAPSLLGIMLQRKVTRQINYKLYNNSLETIRGIYQSKDFNHYGDFVGHLNPEAKPSYIRDNPYPVNPSTEITNYLAEFNDFAISKGALVFFESQANRQSNCDATPISRIQKFYRNLEKDTDITVLTDLKQLCLPDEYFFDTAYHLNATGRRIRTERLIENLARELDTKSTP